MSAIEPAAPDRAQILMMAVIDGESTNAERQELERLIAVQPGLREEWDRMSRVKEVTTTMTLQRPSQETWDHYWSSVYNRAERKVAWLLALGGLVVLLAYWLWHVVPAIVEALLGASDIPLVVRGGIVALLTGAALLLVSVIREQLSTRRTDSYSKGVRR